LKILIPARLNSERLPGKALMDIAGKPMIIRVAEKCSSAIGLENVIVTTPDNEIAKSCENPGFQYVISSKRCQSGTDRLAKFIQKNNDELLINVQGDEPMVPVEVIVNFCDYVSALKETCIGITRIFEDKSINSKNVVKVVE
jgi:3-deoxy-manno-octulosonate cytidylyltransferase (CMP-KDO synthetase)